MEKQKNYIAAFIECKHYFLRLISFRVRRCATLSRVYLLWFIFVKAWIFNGFLSVFPVFFVFFFEINAINAINAISLFKVTNFFTKE